MTIYTIETAAAAVLCGKRTIERAIATGELGHSKTGRLVRITEADLEAWLGANHVPSNAELEAELAGGKR